MKFCNICKTVKEESEFSFRNKVKNKLQSNCKTCQKIRKDEHYQNNKQYYYNNACNSRRKRMKELKIQKSTFVCSECGENHPAILDFHHLDPIQKDFSIGTCIHRYGMKRIQKEISKCIVLCSNCHRKLHWNERNAIIV